MNGYCQKLVRKLMRGATLIFDGQVPDNWDADIYKDKKGYFGIVSSYPVGQYFVLDFVRISAEEYQSILDGIEKLNDDLSIGKYLTERLREIDNRNFDKAWQALYSKVDFIKPEEDEMTCWDSSSKRSQLSLEAYRLASEELMSGNIYRYMILNEISSIHWEMALEDIEKAYQSGEFGNRQAMH